MKTTRPSLSKTPFFTASLAVSLLFAPALRAADTLSSTATASSVAWGTGTNWLDGGFPTSTDDVIIDRSNNSTATALGLNGAQAANSLTFGSATGTPLGTFTIQANTSGTTARVLNITSGAITVDSSVTSPITIGNNAGGVGTLTYTMTSANTWTVASGKSLVMDANVTGFFSVTLAGSGAVTLAGTTAFGSGSTNITTSGTGTLNINSSMALGHVNNSFFITGGSTLDNTSGSAVNLTSTTSGATRINGNFTFTGTNDLTLNGGADLRGATRTITTSGGVLTLNGSLTSSTNVSTSGLTKTGVGKLVLGGAGSYGGATTISGGTLQLGNGGTTGSLLTTGTIVNNGNLTINRSNAVIQGTDFSATAISGTGSFTQAGAGSTTFNVANTYSGITTVTGGGTLNLGIAGAIKNSATNDIVLGGGTLQSAFSQNLNLASLALTAGTANILDLSTGGTFAFANSSSEIWGAGSTLSIVGTFSNTSVRFGTTSSGLNAIGQLDKITINGQSATIDSSGYLVSAVPEPSTYAALAGAAILGFVVVRRRNVRR